MMIIFHTVILIPTCRDQDPLFRSNPVTPSLRLPADQAGRRHPQYSRAGYLPDRSNLFKTNPASKAIPLTNQHP